MNPCLLAGIFLLWGRIAVGTHCCRGALQCTPTELQYHLKIKHPKLKTKFVSLPQQKTREYVR